MIYKDTQKYVLLDNNFIIEKFKIISGVFILGHLNINYDELFLYFDEELNYDYILDKNDLLYYNNFGKNIFLRLCKISKRCVFYYQNIRQKDENNYADYNLIFLFEKIINEYTLYFDNKIMRLLKMKEIFNSN